MPFRACGCGGVRRDAGRGLHLTHRVWDHRAMPDSNTPARDPAKDVLAAEAFGVPARDPHLTHGPVVLPGDPTGIEEPHDVLAAEEFAMPAPAPSSSDGRSLARRAG